MFSDEEILKLKNLTQTIIDDPLPLDQQECIKREGRIWCADWWSVEILKYLFNGESMYLNDPPPNRLKNNSLWSKDIIIEHAKNKLNMLEVLKENKDFSNKLFICEVGRGIDCILARMVKEWDVYCYDSNPHVLEKIKVRAGITGEVRNSAEVDFNDITEPTIVIANQAMFGEKRYEAMKDNPNILPIVNGRIYDGRPEA